MQSSNGESQPAAQRVADALQQRIASWQLPDGHRLLEESLSEEFGVSRSPVREALRRLAAEGYVEIVPRMGYHVRQPSLKDIEDLYELRLALELMVVEKLTGEVRAGRSTDWVEDLRKLPITAETLAPSDRAFHEGLAAAAGNEAIASTLRDINDRLAVFREMEAEVLGRPEETREQHAAILDAICAGEREAATAAVRQNIVDAVQDIERLLGRALVRAMQVPDRSE